MDSPPIQPDRVDRSPRLDQQVDRLADLVLAPIGGLDELAGVEDRRRKGVKAGHHEIARRVVGLFDDVSDLAVVVRVTDAVAGCLIPRHFLDEEGGIRAGFSLAMHDVVEIRLEDVVAQDEHEVVVDVLLGSEQGVGQALLFALVGVRDRNPVPLVAVVLDDVFLAIPHNELLHGKL